MTWLARIEHTPDGLALTFGAPLSRLDMAPDVAQHLASLLAVEARHRMRGVVAAVEITQKLGNSRAPHRATDVVGAENASTSPVVRHGHPLCCDCDHCLNGDQDK